MDSCPQNSFSIAVPYDCEKLFLMIREHSGAAWVVVWGSQWSLLKGTSSNYGGFSVEDWKEGAIEKGNLPWCWNWLVKEYCSYLNKEKKEWWLEAPCKEGQKLSRLIDSQNDHLFLPIHTRTKIVRHIYAQIVEGYEDFGQEVKFWCTLCSFITISIGGLWHEVTENG